MKNKNYKDMSADRSFKKWPDVHVGKTGMTIYLDNVRVHKGTHITMHYPQQGLEAGVPKDSHLEWQLNQMFENGNKI